MKQTTSPSERIYKLYAEYERRGQDTAPIRNALKAATGTMDEDNMMVVNRWLEEISQHHSDPLRITIET